MNVSVNLENNRSVWKGGNVFLNMDVDTNTYHLVCNYCEKAANFSDFNDFLTHAREKHGPAYGKSALADEDNKGHEGPLATNGGEEGRHDYCFGKLSPDETLSISAACPHLYDLAQVKRECLLEIIELLNKCLCIWHKPTRLRTSQKERLFAYQLLLLKLRKFHPECSFKNVRSIVRQLITNYFSEHTRSVEEQDEEEDDDKCTLGKNPANSRTVIEQLMFLAKSDIQDEEKANYLMYTEKTLDIYNHCSFCGIDFYTTNSLWTHMVDAHTPRKTSKFYSPTASCSSCITVDYDELLQKSQMPCTSERLSITSPDRRRKCVTSTDSIYASNCFSENSESDWNDGTSQRQIRKSKRISKRRRFIHEPHAKRQKIIDLTSDTDEADVSKVDLSPSTNFLCDFNDKFLEDFIDLYRQQECLWQCGSSAYRNNKLRNGAFDILLEKYRNDCDVKSASIAKVKQLIRRLRNYYNQTKKPNAKLQRSHIWKKLSFIEDGHPPKCHTRISESGVLVYYCNNCEKTFKRRRYLSIHKLQKHPPTKCGGCLENFGNADDLKKHMLWFHRKTVICPLCRASDVDWKSQRHLAEHFYDNTCRMCGQVFHDINNFQNHKIKCQAKSRFRCWHCDAVFKGTIGLRKHSNSEHNDDRPFKCSLCETTFKFLTPLLKHRKVHKSHNHI